MTAQNEVALEYCWAEETSVNTCQQQMNCVTDCACIIVHIRSIKYTDLPQQLEINDDE